MEPLLKQLYSRMISAMGVEDLEIPLTAVKFYRHQEKVPKAVMANYPAEINLTSCQSAKQASLGDAVCLTIDNIGCIAAAISLGLVDQNRDKPLNGTRVYTDIMHDQSGINNDFIPPTPKNFTEGVVYACRNSGHFDFCLFGKEDSGRYKDVHTAKLAVKDMMAIQPAVMKAVFFYGYEFTEIDLLPDVVVLSVRPVELARIVQAYQFNTGKRVTSTMGAVRVVNSDLIVRPYLTQEINISTYCVGARLIAQYEADRLGIGIPFAIFEEIVNSLEESKTGYPFQQYPGAAE